MKEGMALPAVEAAIRCLEDKEITNAGFGSNLNIDGVKNPISLAKKILDTSSQPLSLRRVPPNILVGHGAKDFADEHGIKTVRNEFLVSRNAKDRYLRWNEDLKRAETRKRSHAAYSGKYWGRRTPTPGPYDRAANPANNTPVGDHTSAILTGHDGSASYDHGEVDMVDDFDYYETYGFDASCDKNNAAAPGRDQASAQHPHKSEASTDMVTDTVGAIAIDLQGNIAAGSSSGGIGMKHRGRIGPAALVGVGTAVVPEDPDDDLATSVAAVTSGTGEHMATCLASGKCAERLFQGTRRGPGGRDIAEEDEHAILESFIVDDFMGHPGVTDQPTVGAIGVMAVKKDRTGVYFYFAHNTDSFALASMSSTEREPLCVMSRLGKTGHVAQGGRKVRLN
ncbi:hypothetical protein NEMBOFW57_009764 [Staphylotrichum longicolle]|uniref:Asparaginase n=1 Tax=Staphylotrichum longicolle TaxID=669026 RepID=A0AAD4ETM6_9PEZI|nr:hypothetical protein NEMBOFW57_009764 [Staphylotrichum longicolle]